MLVSLKFHIETKKRGFVFFYNGSESKWSFTIESMTPIHKRFKLSDYYIIVRENGKSIDRFYLKDEEVVSVRNYSIPHYVKDTIIEIVKTGNINKFLNGKTLHNRFTELGSSSDFTKLNKKGN